MCLIGISERDNGESYISTVCWNRSFYHLRPKNINFGNQPQIRVTLWTSKSPAPLGKKYPKLNALKSVRGTASLYLCHPHLPQRLHGSVPRETYLAGDFSHGREWEHGSEHLAFPAVWEAAKDTHFFLAPSGIRRYAPQLGWGGQGEAGKNNSQGTPQHQRDTDPTGCFVDSTGECPHKLLGMIRLWIPQLAYGYPPYPLSPAPHTSLLTTTPLWLPSYVHPQRRWAWASANV